MQEKAIRALLDATRAVSSSLDLDKVLSLLAEEMIRISRVDGCTLSRWDRDRDSLVTWLERRRVHSEVADAPGTEYPLSRYPATRAVLETRQPHLVSVTDPDADPAEAALLERLGTVSLAMLPLAVGDRVLGLVELDSEEERTFTPEEIRLCQALADQAAIAIEHAHLYQESRDRLRDLVALHKLGVWMTSSLHASEILAAAAESAVTLLRATSAYGCRWDQAARTTTVLAEAFGPEASDTERTSDLGVIYQADSFFVHALQLHQPRAFRLGDPDLPQSWRDHLQEYGGKSVLILPLAAEGEGLTYLEVWESRYEREFTEHEVLLGLNLASQAGAALQNARLYEQAQQEIAEREQAQAQLLLSNRELLSLQAAAMATASSLDRQFVLDTVTWEMANLLDLDCCAILAWDREAGTLTTVAEYHSGAPWRARAEADVFSLGEDSERRRVLLGRHAWQAAAGQPGLDAQEARRMERLGIKALLLLPLVFQDRVLGLVEVADSRRDRLYTDHEVSLAHLLANQAATAMENARLYEQAQQEIAVRKQAERQLEAYAAELERSNQELQQFAYVASHDLQEPLRMVTSYLQLLKRRYAGQLDADADTFIHFAVDGAERMQELIRGLLAYSRVGMYGAPFEPVDCELIVGQVLDNLQVAIRESEARITHDPLPTLPADMTQLGQLFQNLIGNAIKFRGDRRPEIHVGATRQDGAWLFSVRDNGIGIDPRYAERVFVLFQRLHTRDEYAGTGIGLAICKRIVERHGGRIWVESAPGRGSTFYFTLPHDRNTPPHFAPSP